MALIHNLAMASMAKRHNLDLDQLDVPALRSIADYFQTEASRAERNASRREATLAARLQAPARIATAAEEAEKIAKIVEGFITAGRSKDTAVRLTAELTGLRRDIIGFHLQKRRQRLLRESRFRRDREILKFARKGWTDAELAAHFALSKSRISQIIRDAKK